MSGSQAGSASNVMQVSDVSQMQVVSPSEPQADPAGAAPKLTKTRKRAATPASSKSKKAKKTNMKSETSSTHRMNWTMDLEKLLIELRFKDTLVVREFDKIRNRSDRTKFWDFYTRRFNELAKEEPDMWGEGSEMFDVPTEKLKDKINQIRKEYKLLKSKLEATGNSTGCILLIA